MLTYAEEGFAPLNIYAQDYGLDGPALRGFADAVNKRNEPGSLHPRAPVSAVPRALIRDSEDSVALCKQIAEFMRINRAAIGAKKLLIDFRTPEAQAFARAAAEQACTDTAALLEEVVIVE